MIFYCGFFTIAYEERLHNSKSVFSRKNPALSLKCFENLNFLKIYEIFKLSENGPAAASLVRANYSGGAPAILPLSGIHFSHQVQTPKVGSFSNENCKFLAFSNLSKIFHSKMIFFPVLFFSLYRSY